MKKLHQCFRLTFLFLIIIVCCPNQIEPGYCQETKSVEAELRGLWITRWDFSSPQDIARIFTQAKDFHLNTIFFQIRGAGSVYFRSNIEPMAWVNGPADTSWDPLETAVHYAQKLGLQLHAWMNVYPGCNGNHTSENPPFLFRTHPDWFVVDEQGNPQVQKNFYYWLSPTHPRVQAHLEELVRELVENYAIDGLHLDYIRYPGPGYSFDSESIRHFRQLHGFEPDMYSREWDDFRRNSITELLRKFHALAHGKNRNIALSCAVVRNFQFGKYLYFQDVETWINQGVLDFFVPMIYTKNMTLFRRIIKSYSEISGKIPFYPGLIVANNSSLLEQVFYSRQLGMNGHCFFAWSDFSNNGSNSSTKILKNHVYAEPAPNVSWQNNLDPDIKIINIELMPEPPIVGKEIFVNCEISCSDSSLQSQIQPILVWSHNPALNSFGKQLFFEPNKTEKYIWKTIQPIPGQEENDEIFFQIQLKLASNTAADSVLCSSGLRRIQIQPKTSPYRFMNRWGHLLENAEFATVDLQKRIWICERGKSQVRIFEPNGQESAISPLRQVKTKNNQPISLSNLTGITRDSSGSILLSFYSGKGLLAKINSLTGKTELLKQVLFFPGEIDADSAGNIFVIEQDGPCWHVFDSQMNEFSGSPIYGGHISQGIAVNPGGDRVYVTCQAEGIVHCWEGSVKNQRADYRKTDDLPVSGVALGLVETDDAGKVFVSLQEKQSVAVFDPQQNFVTHLFDSNTLKRIIRGIAIEPGDRRLYLVEWGVMSPTRLQKWIRIE